MISVDGLTKLEVEVHFFGLEYSVNR